MLSPAISQTSNDVMEIFYIVYDIVYDVTQFIQPAARLLSGKMLRLGKKIMLAGEM